LFIVFKLILLLHVSGKVIFAIITKQMH